MAGPHVDSKFTLVKLARLAAAAAPVPASVPCVMPVKGTLPVLVSVKTCEGSSVQARIPKIPVPGQFRVCVIAQVVGRKVALITGATPVPVNATGDPVTATLAAMVTVPVDAPTTVGE